MAFALDKAREIAERVALSSGLILWDMELKGSGASRALRIYIDKPEGVTHEDCAAYSREVSTIFDVEDAVPGAAYVLEIAGSLVKFSTRELINGNRHFEGRLVSFSGGQLTVDLDQAGSRKKIKAQGAGVLVVPFANIEKASLVPEF